MNQDKKLETEINQLSALAKEDPNIDIASVMLSSLGQHTANTVSGKQKRWAYLVSLGLPPLGLLFALKFYFGQEDDAKNTALVCVVLTAVSILAFAILTTVMFSGSGASLNQIQQIKPTDIQQILQ